VTLKTLKNLYQARRQDTKITIFGKCIKKYGRPSENLLGIFGFPTAVLGVKTPGLPLTSNAVTDSTLIISTCMLVSSIYPAAIIPSFCFLFVDFVCILQ
jgi:hypothetical protein